MEHSCDHHMLHISDCLDQAQTLSSETRSHIHHCQECAEFLQLWSTDATLDKIAHHPQNVGCDLELTQSIASKIHSPPKAPSRTPIWFSLGAAAAVIFSMVMWNSQSTSPHIPTSAPTPVVTADESIDFSLQLPELDESRINQGINNLTTTSSDKIHKTGKRISRMTQKLHYLTTQFSEFIPARSKAPTPQGVLPNHSFQTS